MSTLASGTASFLVLGLVVGALSGMIGIGGATILVPALVLVFGFSQGRAQGTSVGALVPPIGVFAAIQYYRNGLLDMRAAAIIALGFLFGALGGATIVPYVPQAWLKRFFASILVYVAVELAFSGEKSRAGAVLPGVVAVAALWVIYGVRRVMGKKPPPPPPRRPPPPDTEYYI